MAEIVKTGAEAWTVHLGRELSGAEVKRIVGYRLKAEVTYDYETRQGSTLVTFSDEFHAQEFARWVAD